MNDLSESGLIIPAAFERLTVTKAHELMSISRTTFYRNFLDNGKISISTDEQGKKFIPFAELYRVFGEAALKKLAEHTKDVPESKNGDPDTGLDIPKDNETLMGYTNLKIENSRLEERIQALNERLKDKEERLAEKDTVINRQDRRIETLEGQISNLLEDKSFKSSKNFESTGFPEQNDELSQLKQMVQTLSEALKNNQPEKKKSLWARIFNP